jgi:hypothetical protein
MLHTAPGEFAPRASSRPEPSARPVRPTRMVKRLAVLLAVIAGLAGCAQDTMPKTLPIETPVSSPSISSPSAPPAPAVGPATKPAAKPGKDPTDRIKSSNVIAGMVTKGGSGPCYGITTDDGTQYALHSTAGVQLPKGKYAKVRAVPSALRIYCGPGKLLDLIHVDSIN